MPPLRRFAALLALAPLALPATAGAQPFEDRVLSARAAARAAQAPAQRYPTADGQTIAIQSDDPALAQQYATFVGTLPHGSELGRLRMVVVPADQVNAECGGDPGEDILGCYGSGTMVVPDGRVEGSPYAAEYVITHEYGHHVAANRSNAPLSALAFGPKRWASYELVCANTIEGRLAPGDQGGDYRSNPGEAWADAYAHLVYPGVAWRFTSLLRPTQGSLLAAMADVMEPWTQRTSARFTGSGTRTFQLPLTLDGAFTLQLDGPRAAEYDIVLRAGGRVVRRTDRAGSTDRIHYRIACRDRRTERLTIVVVRRGDVAGPYTLVAKYAG